MTDDNSTRRVRVAAKKKKKPNPRTQRVSVMFTPAELKILSNQAKRAGIKVATLVHRLAMR